MTKKERPIAKFEAFIMVWNWLQGQSTPKLHRDMADWLELCWELEEHRMLLMAFRSAGKSTIVGLFAAWLIYRDPNIRIIVLAADSALAGKMVRNVRRIVERHPLTIHLKPDNADQWASDRFTVKRELELRDPTMLAKGVMSNVTGSRADIVICDDVEVPNTCDTPGKREDLRERLGEIPYVLVSDGSQLYVGTPHHFYSIYADTPRKDMNEEQPFLNSFERYSIPIIDNEGKSAWPERFSEEYIAQRKLDDGPNKFESQMMLKPVNIMEGRLNPDLLNIYNEEIVRDRITNTLHLGPHKMVSASCWWDPSFGSAKGDDSVCAIVFVNEGGDYFLQHLEYIKLDDNVLTNEADQQARIVADLAKEYYLPSISVETNGIGGFLPNILRNVLAKVSPPTRVQNIVSSTPKVRRILEGFDALMASGRLYVHSKIATNTPFLMEMREWQPTGYGTKKSSKGKDDALDAVAGAISRHPDRLERFFGKGAHSWQRGSPTHQSKGQWDV